LHFFTWSPCAVAQLGTLFGDTFLNDSSNDLYLKA
jgi:hypothetical protein